MKASEPRSPAADGVSMVNLKPLFIMSHSTKVMRKY